MMKELWPPPLPLCSLPHLLKEDVLTSSLVMVGSCAWHEHQASTTPSADIEEVQTTTTISWKREAKALEEKGL